MTFLCWKQYTETKVCVCVCVCVWGGGGGESYMDPTWQKKVKRVKVKLPTNIYSFMYIYAHYRSIFEHRKQFSLVL